MWQINRELIKNNKEMLINMLYKWVVNHATKLKFFQLDHVHPEKFGCVLASLCLALGWSHHSYTPHASAPVRNSYTAQFSPLWAPKYRQLLASWMEGWMVSSVGKATETVPHRLKKFNYSAFHKVISYTKLY